MKKKTLLHLMMMITLISLLLSCRQTGHNSETDAAPEPPTNPEPNAGARDLRLESAADTLNLDAATDTTGVNPIKDTETQQTAQ